MHTLTRLVPLVLLIVLLALPSATAAEFPLKDGDTWVFAGDSITAQKQHTNYFEAFCYARYPNMTFRFRNSGVGGDTIPKVMARFEHDVAAWKPTIVSVELGMNDKGGYPTEKFMANMAGLSDKIKSVKVRPVFFTASPVNEGSTMTNLGSNKRLHEYAVALKEFAEKEKAPFADQFHALVDVWGKNKPKEAMAIFLNAAKAVAKDDKLEGVEHLRAFVEAQAKVGKPIVTMMGDPVHPGQTGQLMMAAALLKELGAKGDVSSVQIDAKTKETLAKGCTVENLKIEDDKLSFDRLDECVAFPIPDEARPVVSFDPTILELSRYMLKVTTPGATKYQLKINGTLVATLDAKELSQGVNLTAFNAGPIAQQGKDILKAVSDKEGLVQQWRGQSKALLNEPEKLAAITAKVEQADAKIRAAAKPRKLHFELVPVK